MGSFYAEQVRKALIGRAGDWLDRAAWPRATLVLIFLMATAVAYAVSTSLTNAQVGGLAVRFLVSFAAGYASFFLLSGAWFMLRSPVGTETLMRGAPNEPETHEP